MGYNVKEIVLRHMNRKGSCGYGIKEVQQAGSIKELIDLMLTPKGIEHCMEFQFPDIKLLLQHKDELKTHHVYVDGDHTLKNAQLVVVFGGNITLTIDDYNVSQVYATNDAKVKIIATGNAYVTAERHHNAEIAKVTNGNASVKIFG
ncbi:hypothetical protein [Sphingobacterium corticibacter]|uniref:Uncharacterized protein n=1 Tax=Sphingobacterium corticibacter TaxID=2171749 RepID=A0A2T8HNK9_9SPHI|nr:hypothetical protein [Sphingobacterium corticibacter]PVH27011.1 hypothetical protein DC487_05290 [Sphingobacterium corticibacter]